jgi:hypothetical protein
MPVWLTQDYGTVWVGCRHGVPAGQEHSVRICKDCFDTFLAQRDAMQIHLTPRG